MLSEVYLLWDILCSASQFLHKMDTYVESSVLRVLFSRMYLYLWKGWPIWVCLTSTWESVFDLINMFFEPPTLRKIWEVKNPGPYFWLREGVAGLIRFLYLVWTKKKNLYLHLHILRESGLVLARSYREVSLLVSILSTVSLSLPASLSLGPSPPRAE